MSAPPGRGHASSEHGARGTSTRGGAGWIALVVVAALALVARAGGPPEGALAGGGEGLAGRAWALSYAIGPLWEDGLATLRARFPDGARVWPPLDGVLLAPILGPLAIDAAWNLLAALRVVVAGVGGALVLLRLGLHPAWGLLVAAPVAAGIAPDLAWMPLGLALLLGGRGGVVVGALAGLAWATDAGAAACGWIALALLAPARLRTPAAAAAAAVTTLAWAGEAWTLLHPVDAAAGAAFRALSPRADRGVGSLLGLVGAGDHPWGSPLLLLALLPLVLAVVNGRGARSCGPGSASTDDRADRARTDLARRGALLAGVGVLVVLGPVLVLDDAPVTLNGRTVPLPLLAVGWLPPLAAAADLVPAAILAWLGAAVAAGAVTRGAAAPFLLAPLVFLAPVAPWTVPPAIPPAEGPVLEYPPSMDGWPLYAAARAGVATSAGLGGAAPEGLVSHITREGWSLAELRSWAAEQGFASLRVDTRAPEARAHELALVIGAVTAVPDAWPDLHVQGWPARIEAPTPPPDLARPPEGEWAWRDPSVAKFLDPSLFARARFLLRVYTSPDGLTWTPAAAPFAHSFTSLGLTVVDDEALLVTGTPGLTGWLAREFPQMNPAFVLAFTTDDLAVWGVRGWWLEPRVPAVDPQIDAVDGALTLTAWLRTGGVGADPVSLGGDHPVYTARLRDEPEGVRFVPDRPTLALPWLADPMRVGDLVFATLFAPGAVPSVVVLGEGPGGWDERARIDGISVPFVWRDAAGWTMFAHGRDRDGSLTVVRASSVDGLAWSAPERLALPRGASCESPVGARFRGQHVLVCSERVGTAQDF